MWILKAGVSSSYRRDRRIRITTGFRTFCNYNAYGLSDADRDDNFKQYKNAL